MKKIFIISIDVYRDLDIAGKKALKNFLISLKSDNHYIIFTSRDANRVDELIGLNGLGFKFIVRDLLKSKMKNKEIDNESIIFIGNKDLDLYMAVWNKSFFIVPLWCNDIQDKPEKYGLKIKSINDLSKVISIILNQKNWFYELKVDDKTTVLALTSANTKGNHSIEEIELINGFREYLKEGGYKYYSVLLYHFLAGIVNKPDFREIQDWSIIPSSGTELNEEMLKFKERARYLMNGKKKENIFIRHTKTEKSHESYKNGVNRIPCDRHFDTIKLNLKYKGKLKDRVVCVFDDYSTNGTSFEVARNLLLKEGVKKIYFVALGKFGIRNPYKKQSYNIKGNLYEAGSYDYELIENSDKYGIINKDAIKEIEILHEIIYAN